MNGHPLSPGHLAHRWWSAAARSSLSASLDPSLLLTAGRGGAFLASFCIPVVLARMLDQTGFGTYKQIFLLYATLYNIAQFGMAESLFYFLPLRPREGGRFVVNSTLFLAGAGLVGSLLLVAGAERIGGWLHNPDLPGYLPLAGTFLVLTMASAGFEMVLIARGRHLGAALAYALSDLVKAACLLLPALLLGGLNAVLMGGLAFASLRLAACCLTLRREFEGGLRPDPFLLSAQLAYVGPFGLAVLVEIVQGSLHQYIVSATFDPATFALYAVGCLQIPIVEFVASPACNVMMVRMRESLREGRGGAVLELWHDATRRIALFAVPVVAVMLLGAHELIVGLFTETYAASVPVFMIGTASLLAAVLQTDGVLRVYADTRRLLALSLLKLLLIGLTISWFLSVFHLPGAALATLTAALLAKLAALARVRRLLDVPLSHLLPWRALGTILAAGMVAAVPALLLKMTLNLAPLPLLAVVGTAYLCTYLSLLPVCLAPAGLRRVTALGSPIR